MNPAGIDFRAFHDSLAMLVETGLPLPAGLVRAGRARRRPFRAAIERVAAGVGAGRRLSEAMAAEPGFFPPAYVAIVAAGEEGGNLAAALRLAMEHEDMVSEFRHRVRSSLIYPAVVFVLGLAGWLVITLITLPEMTQFYELAGARLPAHIRLAEQAVFFLTRLGVLLPLLLAGLWVVYRRGPLQAWLHGLYLRVPLLGTVLQDRFVASMAGGVADGLRAGMPLARAVGLAATIAPNAFLGAALGRAARRVDEGARLAEALATVPGFPELALTAIAGGEGAALPGTLTAVAEYYRAETAEKSRRFIFILDQALIASAGLWVAGFVISFYTFYSQIILVADGLTRW